MRIKNSAKIAVLIAVAGAGAQSQAIPLTDVGAIDLLIASAALPSSDEAQETAWVESVLGLSDLTFETKIENGFSWQTIDGMNGVWAQQMETDPGYYLVKTGKKSSVGPGHTHFLFDNLAGLNWAVVNLQDLGFDPDKVDFTKISHISEFGQELSVPEPSLMALVGLGLLGLSTARRRGRKG